MSGVGDQSRRRRRQRNGSGNPEDGGGIEMQETRLRGRGVQKDTRLSLSKRRRLERTMHGGGGGDADESSENSLDGDGVEPAAVPFPLPGNHESLPWKPDDGGVVKIPKKARSASAKRLLESWVSGAGGDQIHLQAYASASSIHVKEKPIGGTGKQPQPNKAKPDADMVMVAEALAVEALAKLGEGNLIEINQDGNNNANGFSSEPNSPVPSPNPISPAPVVQPDKVRYGNPSSNGPSTAVAPKRKRPSPVGFEDENPGSTVPSLARSSTLISSVTKTAVDQPIRMEAARPKSDKLVSSSANENGSASPDSTAPHCVVQQEPRELEGNPLQELIVLVADSNSREQEEAKKKVELPRKETPPPALDEANTAKFSPAPSGAKFTIDLMADPEKSSPERDGLCDFVSDDRPMAQEIQLVAGIDDQKKEAEAIGKSVNQNLGESSMEDRNAGKSIIVEDFDSRKQVARGETVDRKMKDITKEDIDSRMHVARGETVDHQKMEAIIIDDTDSMNSDNVVADGKHELLKPQSKAASSVEPQPDKIVSSSMSMPMTVAGWPGSSPPFWYMGQVPSLQAIIPAGDATTASSSTRQPLNFPPPPVRRNRNSTHCYIAQSIQYYERIMQMTPFWPASAGTPQIQGSLPRRSLGSLPGSNGASILTAFTGHTGTGTMNGNIIEAVQRAPLVFQQTPPQPGSANNMIMGPALIFPINQHPSMVAAAAVQSVAGNPTPGAETSLPSSGVSGYAVASSVGGRPVVAMNFGYSTDQYLSILQNNGYPFPIPANIGGPASYRGGSPGQVMPLFSGPFYSPPMLHHSQLQLQKQQQQLLPPPTSVPQQLTPPGHQNTSTFSGSSFSQKHKQQQQRVPGGGANDDGPSSHSLLPGGGANGVGPSSHSLPSTKQLPQMQTNLTQQLESGKGSEHKQSNVERVLRAQKGLYANHLAIPIHRQNAPLFSNAAAAAAELSNGVNCSEKQPTQQQQSVMKVDLSPSLSLASTNGGASPSGMDFSSIAQGHTLSQNRPEVARHGYQMTMATAAAAAVADSMQEKKAHAQFNDGGKLAGSSLIHENNATDEERKMVALNTETTGNSISPHSSSFAKPEVEPRTRTFLGNNVVNGSSRALNANSASANSGRTSNRSTSATAAPTNTASVTPGSNPAFQQLQKQVQEQQMQHQYGSTRGKSSASSNNVSAGTNSPTNTVSMPLASNPTFQQFQQLQRQAQEQQLHLQHQYGLNREKSSASRYSAGAYSERIPSGSTTTKFPQMLTSFPQGVTQGGNPSQPPQWKTSSRSASPASTPSVDPLAAKSHHQQQGTPAPSSSHQTNISFGINAMKSAPNGAQHFPRSGTANASTASTAPAAVGSPSNSVPKSTGGNPRESASTKPTPANTSSNLMQSNGKNSASNGNALSNLGQPQHIAPSTHSSSSGKRLTQLPQYRSQPQRGMQKQPHLFFSNAAYMQTKAPPSSVADAAVQHQQQHQKQSLNLGSSCGLTLAGGSSAASSSARAGATTVNSTRVPPPGLLDAAQNAASATQLTTTGVMARPLMSAVFPYISGMSGKPSGNQKPGK